MKYLKLFTFVMILTFLAVVVSCNSTQSKLKGTWKVSKVDTKFDENTMTPEMIKQVTELQKQTYFRILDDSAMVIISNNNPHDARWQIDKNNVITYRFKNSTGKPNKLGIYKNGLIKSESKTPLGTITTWYEKQ